VSITYTHATQRDDRQAVIAARRLDTADLLLISTTLIGVLTIGLTYAGLGRRGALSDDASKAVNLHTVTDAREIEVALGGLSTANPADRRAAARELVRFLTARRDAGERVPNVAALLGAKVLTSRDLAAIKPAFIVRTPEEFGRTVLLWGLAYVLSIHALVLLWRVRAVDGDRLVLAAAHLLTALGFAALLSRADALRDSLLFVRYTVGVLIGVGVMGALSLVDFRKTSFVRLSYVPLLGALCLSVLLILFGHGPGRSGAKVNLGPVQPIEAIRLLLALFLAGYFARRWELLRHTPRLNYAAPVFAGVGAALMFFFLQKDLGPALFLTCVFLVLYAVATGRIPMAIAGFAVLAAGIYVGYRLNVSDTLAARVEMWQSPWHNAIRGGDQIAQAVWALATGGFFGTGPGLGDTRYLPAGHTDLMLAAVGEELGIVGLAIVAAAYCAIAWRGLRIASAASTDYGFFLATAVTLFLIVPVLVMSAGMLGVIPLTGVVTPFLSYGGSAMTANFAALGILTAIHVNRGTAEAAEPFRTPVRYLGAALGASAVAIAGVLLNVQLVNADGYASKPHFGVQADGVGRHQYNPRVLDLMREIPRGSVYDRAGLPLATGDAHVVQRAREGYRRLGVPWNATCDAPIERCYPLGGPAFHLLGDSSSRMNWSATNTSYLERDAQDRLRGFRDHRELVPALRHRYDREHESVRTLMEGDRDVRLTLDARLQFHVATILSNYARRFSRTGKAAAVVLDADTGNVLAIASHPWPEIERASGSADAAPDTLLDRARYGLYPPGSTFKLVTAAAALRRDVALSRTNFTCARLPDHRVGVRIPGHRVVRDDVLDTRPHGTIDMRDALVHSCNAYFGQLALDLGPDALVDTAAALGISVVPASAGEADAGKADAGKAGTASRLQATLPQAGYGQGDVVVTPLRMARVAAAIASDGVLRPTRLETGGARPVRGDVLLRPHAARMLARYMRDAVMTGTGRSLRNHPWRVAGKTGTAEVAGAASHSWFVGFAPYGRATKRVAFAVIIENAGYGSLAAAPVAGEIVSAAASAGLIR
jgi:cell division protein FtsW (lipid II flippase)